MSSYRLPDGSIPVLLSADTPAALHAEVAALTAYLAERPAIGPERVADMLFRTRAARRHRALLAVTDRAGLDAALAAVRAGRDHPGVFTSTEPAAARKVAYVLPGQGGQRPGMGALFYERVPAYRAEADRFDAIFRDLFGASPLPYLLDPETAAENDATTVQPALFTQMAGLGAMWKHYGVPPALTVGHSQGEIAAAYLAGVISDVDAALVVGSRARAVDGFASDRYAMAVLAADREECEDVLARRSGWAQVSVVNSPTMVGISGDRDTVAEVVAEFAARGRFARVIKVRYPAHTAALAEFRDVLREAVRDRSADARFAASEIACVGATLGDLITPDLPVEDYWFWNLRNPVRFDRAIEVAVAREADTFVELAEHPTLRLAVEENLAALRGERALSVHDTSARTAVDLAEFTANLATLAVGHLDYRWDGLRVASDAPPPLPLADFPHSRMNEIPLYIPWNETRGEAGTLGTAATVGSSVDVAAGAAAQPAATGPVVQVLVERWSRLTRRSMTAPKSLGVVDHTGEAADLAAALVEHGVRQGLEVRALDLESGGVDGAVDTVVVLLPALPALDGDAAAEQVAEFLAGRRWLSKPESGVTEYWLLTVGGEAVLPEDAALHPVPAAAAAGFRVVGAEFPGVAFRHLDLAPDGADPAAVASIVTALHTAEETELALRAGNLYVKRLVEAGPDLSAGASAPAHVLITGGTGSLGLEFCDHAVRGGARRVTLLSRSGETERVAARLRAARALGDAEIDVLACDIGDRDAVARVAEHLCGAPADLIVHAAADNAAIGALEITEITHAQVRRALSGKVVGVDAVLDLIPRSADCEIVLCSSLAATLGGRGTIVYAAANRMVDALARRRRAEGLRCVSVQWGQWAVFEGDGGGADIAQLAQVGYLPMASADAIARGLGGLRDNAVVAAFDWERGRTVLGAFGYGPVLSELTNPPDVDRPSASGPARVAARAVPAGDVPGRVRRLLAEIIGADDVDTIDSTKPLVAIGLDSLQALNLRKKVRGAFDTDVPVADLIGGACLDDVIRLINGGGSAATEPPPFPVSGVGESRRSDIASVVIGSGDSAQAPVKTGVAPLTRTAPALPALPTGATVADRLARAKQAAQHAVPADFDEGRFRSARRDADLFGARAMLAAVRPALSDTEIRAVDDIAERMAFAPRHRWLLRQWLRALALEGAVEGDLGRGFRYAGPVPAPVRADLFEVCADLGYPAAVAEFFRASDEHLVDLVRDEMRLQELLFPNGDMATAEGAYRDNLSSRYLNLAAGRAVADVVAELRADRAPVRVLELGAGIGGTTDDVTAALVDLPVDYHFTDVSDFFLTAARERFADYPWMRYGLLDMNADLGDQPARDLVIAANVLHNAFDIGVTLRRLRDLLNPGGAVVIVETCHAHNEQLTSVHLLMSPGRDQPHAGLTDVRAGTDRIFLTEDEWRRELAAAGLRPELVLPAGEHPVAALDQRVFVARRDHE
ncbi:nocobactin polyketide synthase NbtC [Nocardia takedensis]|uniref:nocobactin polyketide synthase NbtC n=1 Tax=Nocardia takedensis TaxID=259390 RepID=UPI00068476F2